MSDFIRVDCKILKKKNKLEKKEKEKTATY